MCSPEIGAHAGLHCEEEGEEDDDNADDDTTAVAATPSDETQETAIAIAQFWFLSLALLSSFVSLALRSSSLWITPPRREEIQMPPWPLVRVR